MHTDPVLSRIRALAESIGYSARLREVAWQAPGAEIERRGLLVEASRNAVAIDREQIRSDAREVERCLRDSGERLWQALHDHVQSLLVIAVDWVDRESLSANEARVQAADLNRIALEFLKAADDPVAAFTSPAPWISITQLELYMKRRRAEGMKPASESSTPKLVYGSNIPLSAKEVEELAAKAEWIMRPWPTEPTSLEAGLVEVADQKLTGAFAKAYLSFKYAEYVAGEALKDGDAYDWLAANGIDAEASDDFGILADYPLPARATWLTYVIKGRSAAGEKKNGARVGRTGRSILNRGQL